MTASALPRSRPTTPDRYERLLAAGSIILLLFVLAALARGHAHWRDAGATVWAHLATITVALALTPWMLLKPRGDRRHRRLGWVWATAMILTALLSFGVHTSRPPNGWSAIHILSAATLLLVPRMVWSARTHRVAQHRLAVRGIVTGALLIAGFFTFPFDRLLGHWLFG